MKVNPGIAGLLVIAAALALGGAYALGRKSAEPAAAPASPPAVASPHRAEGAMPANHPKVEQAAAEPQRAGKVAVDHNLKFVHFRVGNKNVKRILVDGDLVWVGTSGGVIRYDSRSDEYRLFDVKSGLLSNGIFHVGRLDGRLVVGTYGGGMSLLDPKTEQWETFNIPQGLGDAFVYDILEASNGDVWIATWSGVNRVRGGALRDRSKWDLYTVENTKGGLPNDWVYGLAEGRNGEVWLGTEGGLARFKDGKWENWNHARGLGADYEVVKNDIQFNSDPSRYSQHHAKQKEEMGLQNVNVAYNPNYIVSLAVDRDGVVWAGTWGGGLSRFDGKQWKSYTVADGLPGNHVFMLHVDREGQLWVGTNNGLARMREGAFETMTTHDGLFANAVFSMATQPDGTLWVGSFGGVAKIRSAVN
ncbi:MAG TPA: two-component regulator propeller domain-containing protein [Pelomicrobium sp.]|nr:two-component regulator propeller domain-containing protein [Pelomicrobium sp.]